MQRRFLKYLYYVCFQYYPYDVSYEELLEGFELDSLEQRKTVALLTFPRDIMQGNTDTNLLRDIGLRVPSSQRRLKEMFYMRRSRTGALHNTVVNRACNLYNRMGNSAENLGIDLDILSQSRKKFGKAVVKVIRSFNL